MCIHMVFYQYEFVCDWVNWFLMKKFLGKKSNCTVFHRYGISCDSLNWFYMGTFCCTKDTWCYFPFGADINGHSNKVLSFRKIHTQTHLHLYWSSHALSLSTWLNISCGIFGNYILYRCVFAYAFEDLPLLWKQLGKFYSIPFFGMDEFMFVPVAFPGETFFANRAFEWPWLCMSMHVAIYSTLRLEHFQAQSTLISRGMTLFMLT